MNNKYCSNCNKDLPISSFSYNKHNKDGYQYWCKVCMYKSTTNWRKNNPEKLHNQLNKHYHKNREHILDIQKKYNKSERGIKTRRKYYENNRDLILKKQSEWVKNNRDKVRYKVRMRYYQRMGIIHNWTRLEYFDKLYSTNGKCQLCDKEVGFGNLEMDHIIPISKVTEGTIYMIEDIQFLCKKCNRSKSNKCNVDIEYIDI